MGLNVEAFCCLVRGEVDRDDLRMRKWEREVWLMGSVHASIIQHRHDEAGCSFPNLLGLSSDSPQVGADFTSPGCN